MNREKRPKLETSPSTEKETIASCAVMFGDQVFEAGNHGMAYEEGREAYPDETNIIDGYTTSTGRFVSREEGMKILREADDSLKD
jgi:hypothetical protein